MMKFQFKCDQCGKEIQVVVKLVAANQIVELPKELEAATILVKCPSCGHAGKVSMRPGAGTSERLARLKVKNARNPCMN